MSAITNVWRPYLLCHESRWGFPFALQHQIHFQHSHFLNLLGRINGFFEYPSWASIREFDHLLCDQICWVKSLHSSEWILQTFPVTPTVTRWWFILVTLYCCNKIPWERQLVEERVHLKWGSWSQVDTHITIMVQADTHGTEAAAERSHLHPHRKERTLW